jgi:hypothetical protein
VLYTIGVVGFVLFSWWWAWWCPKHVETPINTSSFLHLVGYLFKCIPLLEKLDWFCTFLPNHKASILPNVNRILVKVHDYIRLLKLWWPVFGRTFSTYQNYGIKELKCWT